MVNQILDACWLDASRLTVVVGHSGSGKTEFSVNLAMALGKLGHPFALADLDVVNPYFRSRECKQVLEQQGGRLIASSQACLDADVPAMPPDLLSLLQSSDQYGVLDIGGDPSGARVLARYRAKLQAENARVLFVVNANRPSTCAALEAIEYLRGIEAVSGFSIDGIVNNTHLCEQTEAQDIMRGATLAKQISEQTGIPVVCHVVSEQLMTQVPDLSEPVFPIQLYMKKPWE